MGKKPRKFTLRKVRATPITSLGALASGVAVNNDYFGAADADYLVTSVENTWSYEDHTAGEGPITCGYAHGDYSVTEIKECLESASINMGNMIQRERARRLVRIVGAFSGQNVSETLNDGKPIKTRLNWKIPEGITLKVFFYNDSTSNLTTATLASVMGHGWIKNI